METAIKRLFFAIHQIFTNNDQNDEKKCKAGHFARDPLHSCFDESENNGVFFFFFFFFFFSEIDDILSGMDLKILEEDNQ